ncbi:unnamed protein product [Fusarium venenatum]|uniref:Uncharacterized protein n=1 Tax=Fusarium venenatum TaxID=56646 RepID=A0A2L2TGK0_9HYPO|nr:uncharacterized protein FVRRES_09196 [Fusarium venenatum]CEI69119.1 unnamed protein product [Fusarium venenatum]
MKLIQGKDKLTKMTSNSEGKAVDRKSDQNAQRQDEGWTNEGTKRSLADGYTRKDATRVSLFAQSLDPKLQCSR